MHLYDVHCVRHSCFGICYGPGNASLRHEGGETAGIEGMLDTRS